MPDGPRPAPGNLTERDQREIFYLCRRHSTKASAIIHHLGWFRQSTAAAADFTPLTSAASSSVLRIISTVSLGEEHTNAVQPSSRVAAGRLDFDAVGFMNMIRPIMSALSAAVAHS